MSLGHLEIWEHGFVLFWVVFGRHTQLSKDFFSRKGFGESKDRCYMKTVYVKVYGSTNNVILHASCCAEIYE